MSEDNWLLDTIVAKSDQLNAVDLVGGPVTVRVASVSKGDAEQPVIVGIGDRQPYKPCKSMRRVLIACWGANPAAWIGRQMTLYCEPSVKWGGESVGGIRISHLSHIDADVKEVQLNESKHKKITYKVYRLDVPIEQRVELAVYTINQTKSLESLKNVWAKCGPLYADCSSEMQKQLLDTKNAKEEALKS